MASGVTNRGRKVIANTYFRADATDEPTAFKVALCTSAVAPTVDTNVLADLTEIAAGNGYTAGGLTVERSAVGWDTITEDDGADLAFVLAKDLVWTASGGPLPASGGGARWAVLLDDDTTPNLVAWWDLTSDQSVSDGQSLTLQDCRINLTLPV